MKYIFLFVLAIFVIIAGCSQPETSEKISELGDAPTVEIGTDPVYIQATLHPLETSSDYVPIVNQPTTSLKNQQIDPVIGNWKYSGSSYQCDVAFSVDNSGSVSCFAGIFPVASKQFKWVSVQSQHNWMRNYTLTETSSGINYTVLYSGENNGLTSDIIPDGGYLIKVN